MRTQRSKIGRRRKVFKQEKAHISFTGKAVTSHAGMAVVSRKYRDVHSYISIGQNILEHDQHHNLARTDKLYFNRRPLLFPEFIKLHRIGSEQSSLDNQEILKQLDEMVSGDISDKCFQHIQYHLSRASSFFLSAIVPLSSTVSKKSDPPEARKYQRYGIMRSSRHGSVPRVRFTPRASHAVPRTF